jgi:hypothetical protein
MAAVDVLGSRLDRLTEAAQPMTGELARLRYQQDRVAVQMNEASAAMARSETELRQAQAAPGPEVFEHMVRLGAELEGASDRLRQTSQQMTQEEQDRRGQMATLDLGLRLALTGMEAVVSGRQSEQVAELKDAQREVVEVVDRLTREVQLLRPAIDLRSGADTGLLNGAALERFADRVASLLSDEVLARLDGSPPALSRASIPGPDE